MKVSYQSYFLALPIIMSLGLESQGLSLEALGQLTDLEEVLETNNLTKEDPYGSYTSNELNNTVNQIRRIDEIKIQKEAEQALLMERMRLAFQLCSKDESACYLLENYQKYKFSQEIELDEGDLQLYGVDLFSNFPLNFDRSDIAGPSSDYALRVGDVLRIELYGSTNFDGEVYVDYEGNISIPRIGSLNVGGLTIIEAKKRLGDYIEEKLVGTESNLTMFIFSTIQVYSLGAVKNPGLYNLGASSNTLNSIIASGGFKKNSSLRNIKILRNGELINNVDLYDFLIFGDSASEMRLLSGDTVMVPAIQDQVSIYGAVNRPAIYEIKSGDTVGDIINFAQGLLPGINELGITIKSKNNNGIYEVRTVDNVDDVIVRDGDVIYINTIVSRDQNFIKVHGEIRNPGIFSFRENMYLSNILYRDTDLLDTTYPLMFIVKRFNKVSNSFNYLVQDLLDNGLKESFLLNPNDEIFFLSKEDIKFINSSELKLYLLEIFNKQNNIESNNETDDLLYSLASSDNEDGNPLSSLTSLRNTDQQPYEIEGVCLSGFKNFADFNFINDSIKKLNSLDTLNDVKCTKNLNKYPFLLPVALNNSIPVTGSLFSTGLFPVSEKITAAQIISYVGGSISNPNETSYNIASYSNINPNQLLRNDLRYVNAFSSSDSGNEGFVRLVGEFNFPGSYQITPNTTIEDLIQKAGGYTNDAFIEGGIFTRKSIQEREIKALSRAKQELTQILTTGIMTGLVSQSSKDIVGLMSLINDIDDAKVSGRMIVDLDLRNISSGKSPDFFLEPGDTIFMPQRSSTVSIMGSVLNPISIPYNPRNSISDYIDAAGGYNDFAKKNSTYVVLPSGKAITTNSFLPFNKGNILPGSTIIVPRNQRPLQGFTLVEAITPVLANLSITAASLSSINN